MNRVIATFVVIAALLAGCIESTSSFQGQIQDIREDRFIVDCSDEVNRGKKGVVNTIGYGCSVEFTNETTFRDADGKPLTFNEFNLGSTVRVILSKPVNIRRNIESDKPSVLIAKEVILLTREEVSSKEDIIKELEKQGLNVTDGVKDPQSTFQIRLRGIEPYVYSVNGEELILYHFQSEQEQVEGWSEYLDITALTNAGPFKNYNLDSFLLIFKYGKDLNTETDTKIQRAIDNLASYK